METTHQLLSGDARDLSTVASDAVDLVITSPPYPMIDMWDDIFTTLDPAIGDSLDAGDGLNAFDRMHEILGDAWDELARVLIPGGIACINIGDATRNIGGHFQTYPNAARVMSEMADRGFVALPEILWSKPTNSGAKFMGSGMLPPNAYVTLEHEHILIFRNGPKRRSFDPGAKRRYEAAYFWEERNQWFSDIWTNIRGVTQTLENNSSRKRSGAFPLTLPYRLINMYSVYGDTVLDPFCGTGTTNVAAMIAGRHSVGVDRDDAVRETLHQEVNSIQTLAVGMGQRRLADHHAFIAEHQRDGGTFGYEMAHYPMPVKTAQEQEIQLYCIDSVQKERGGYTLTHSPLSWDLP